ncbi:MAG: hypothetical protein KTR22_05120 [Flavobacteriaceae bacterium]|nr:hypothetical protein [Flavobacteriaceae bacterium]
MKYILSILIFTFALQVQAQRSDFDEIDFARADYIAESYKGEELFNMYGLTHGIATSLRTDVERFRAIYVWVCHNISADYRLMSLNDAKREALKDDPMALTQWNNAFSKEMYAKLFNDKKTLCTGYAYLLKKLSELMGLECEMVYGYGQTIKKKLDHLKAPNHTWNAIKLNGKWYLCDPTWSSGTINTATYEFTFTYDDSFFLMNPSEFAKTHLPLDKKWLLTEAEQEAKL